MLMSMELNAQRLTKWRACRFWYRWKWLSDWPVSALREKPLWERLEFRAIMHVFHAFHPGPEWHKSFLFFFFRVRFFSRCWFASSFFVIFISKVTTSRTDYWGGHGYNRSVLLLLPFVPNASATNGASLAPDRLTDAAATPSTPSHTLFFRSFLFFIFIN